MATTKRNRNILNIVMVVLAAVVVVAGIVFVMTVRGGGQETTTGYVAAEKVGYANIERSGISYTLDEGTALQAGDAIETLNGSEVVVSAPGETTVYLADASQLKVQVGEAGQSGAGLQLVSGCLLADVRSSGEGAALAGSSLSCAAEDAVLVLDVRTGTETAQVLAGSVKLGDGTTLEEGESYTLFTNREDKGSSESASATADTSASPGKLSLASLDPFTIEHALDLVGAGRELAYGEKDLAGELDRRQAEKQQLTQQAADENKANSGESAASGSNENAAQGEAPAEGEGAAEDPAQNEPAAEEPNSEQAAQPNEDKAYTCTVQIRCDTILNNMDKLAEGKNKYVPKSGELLRTTTVVFEEGETAFDVLQRVCNDQGIALEYSFVPVYGSYYIEGIGNLYEFDCGDQSGWMFKVNGWFPNYGCSEYALSDGDAVVFCYTCNGLGEDVGA